MSLAPVLDFRKANDSPPDMSMPGNIEIEQAILGILMYDNEALFRCEGLEPKHFLEPFHGRLFSAISDYIAKDRHAEPITLADLFNSDGAFLELGGVRYLADLYANATMSFQAKDYAEILIDLSLRRELIHYAGELVAVAKSVELDRPARLVLDEAERELFKIAETKGDEGGFATFGSAADIALDLAAQAYARDGALSGLSTGLIDLDQKLGGLHPSDLLVLAGRPSMGKTALATNIAFNVAKSYVAGPVVDGVKTAEAGGVVAFYSLEMGKEQLAARILSEVSGVSSDKVRKGQIDATEFGRLRDARDEMRDIPLHIDATGGISIAKLTARARRLKRKHGLDLIVVDYLQLVTADGRGREGRVQEISAITGGLKALAKDLGVPVIALSQLSRQVESREDKKPMLSDLRESGSIEQDADAVMFVYREEYYLGRTEPKAGTSEHVKWCAEMDQVRGVAEVIVGKQRHGPIGTVRLHFNEQITKFGNLAREGRDFGDARLPYGRDD